MVPISWRAAPIILGAVYLQYKRQMGHEHLLLIVREPHPRRLIRVGDDGLPTLGEVPAVRRDKDMVGHVRSGGVERGPSRDRFPTVRESL